MSRLCALHRNHHEIHRELKMKPQQAWNLANPLFVDYCMHNPINERLYFKAGCAWLPLNLSPSMSVPTNGTVTSNIPITLGLCWFSAKRPVNSSYWPAS